MRRVGNAVPSPMPPEPLGYDVHCAHCGYNLRGRAAVGPCPECGEQIEATRTASQAKLAGFARTALLSGGAGGLWFGFFQYALGGWSVSSAVAGALGFGCMMGLLMGAWTGMQRQRALNVHLTFTDERLLREGWARWLTRWRHVSGWLFVTDRRLMFRADWGAADVTISLADISKVRRDGSGCVIPNCVRVTTHAGAVHRFMVQGRRRWVEAIMSAMRQDAVAT